MLWIIQKNLNNNYSKWIDALEACGSKFTSIEIIPFADSVPDIDPKGEPVVVYGTTTMIKNAHKNWNPGVFFNPNNFKCSTWIEKWGDYCFNAEGTVTTLDALQSDDCPETCFIRPNNDLKDFSGVIVQRESLHAQIANIKKGGFPFGGELEVFIAPIKHIQKEWRVYVIGGKVITASQYKLKSMVILDSQVEQEVLDFAQKMADIWTPESAFVMDICLNNQHEYKILELNCINGSGAYLCDLKKVILAIEALF